MGGNMSFSLDYLIPPPILLLYFLIHLFSYLFYGHDVFDDACLCSFFFFFIFFFFLFSSLVFQRHPDLLSKSVNLWLPFLTWALVYLALWSTLMSLYVVSHYTHTH